jgi:magnesium transporter
VLEQVSETERDALVALLRRNLDPEVLTELDDAVRDDVLEQLDSKDIAAAARQLETDDAASLLEDMPEDERREVLAEIPAEERAEIEKALAYPEDSAGRMMQRSLVKVPQSWTVGQVIDYCREAGDLPEDVYDLFVVDRSGRLKGSVPLGRMLRSKRPVPIMDIVDPDISSVPAIADQAEVAHLFRDQNLVSCPVVDNKGRLLGVIMVDDVVDVIDEEAEEDLLKMGGVGHDDMHANTVRTVRLRGVWLAVNLFTAVVASLVIGQFEGAIEKIVALAVLMPIVASMGGNAGTQTVTVAVRALAMGELTPANALRFIGKEIAVGGLNGMIFALLMGAAVVLWYQDWRLGAVIGAAMICNLLAAALAGTLIPIGLQKFGVDPAVSSTVFLTTVTDVIGFLAFLGLATLFLL